MKDEWTATTGLPSGRYSLAAVAHGGRIYVLGGAQTGGSELDDVLMASIAGGGSLGIWSSLTSLPSPRAGLASVAHDGHLYAIGGGRPGALTADVHVAAIAGDGTIGAWTVTTSLPAPRMHHAAVVHEDRIYVLGGFGADGTGLAEVLAAPIAGDGSVGSWSPLTGLPQARAMLPAVTYGDHLYSIGGHTGGVVHSDVLFATTT